METDQFFRLGFGIHELNGLSICIGYGVININFRKLKFYYYNRQQCKLGLKYFFGFVKEII